MKQIKDYIGKNYAIHCDTQEKHDKIYQLLKEQQYNYYSGHPDYWKNYGKEFCFCLDEKDLTFASVDSCKNKYTILKAEEFLEPKSLVGRWVKCISWIGTNAIEGKFYQITEDNGKNESIIYCIAKGEEVNIHLSVGKFQLMPENWTPETEKPKFEKDKWYIIDCYSNSYYVKFDKLYDNGTCIQASDCMSVSNLKLMGSGGFRDYKNARAVNLSEIQQYLPDNHPDKQKLEETKPNLSDLYNTYIPLNNEEEYKQLLVFLPTIGFTLAYDNYFKNCPNPAIEFYYTNKFNVLANGGQVKNKKLSILDLKKYGFELKPIVNQPVNSYIVDIKPTSNSNIEIGDEIQLISGCSYAGYDIGDRAIVIDKNPNNCYFSVYQKGTTKVISGCVPQYWKIIKKNSQTTLNKTDDFGSLQVTNTQTTDIKVTKRSSVTLNLTEKEVKINIKKQKPVKI